MDKVTHIDSFKTTNEYLRKKLEEERLLRVQVEQQLADLMEFVRSQSVSEQRFLRQLEARFRNEY